MTEQPTRLGDTGTFRTLMQVAGAMQRHSLPRPISVTFTGTPHVLVNPDHWDAWAAALDVRPDTVKVEVKLLSTFVDATCATGIKLVTNGSPAKVAHIVPATEAVPA